MILYDKMQTEYMQENMGELLKELPEDKRKAYLDMIEAERRENYDEVIRIASETLQTGGLKTAEEKGAWALCLSRTYLNRNQPKEAFECVEELVKEKPQELAFSLQAAVCCQVSGRLKEAAGYLEAIYPPQRYSPFYYTTYGDVLERQKQGEKAFRMFRVVAEKYKEGYDPGAVLMDGVYQRLICLDMENQWEELEEDIEAYLSFLNNLDNTSEMQQLVGENLVIFSNFLEPETNRRPFLKLLDGIREMGFFTERIRRRTLTSGYSALELYALHEKGDVSAFMWDFLVNSIDLGTEEDRENDQAAGFYEEGEESVQTQEEVVLFLHYSCGKRLPDILSEFDYVKGHYPWVYGEVEPFVRQLREDGAEVCNKALAKLLERTGKHGCTKSSYDRLYMRRYEKGRGTVIWETEGTYVRPGRKIGRNEPCPCGSGKKYKNCCGRGD